MKSLLNRHLARRAFLEPLARGCAYVALIAWLLGFTALGWRLITTVIIRRTEA
jgi:hypothetical protein